MQLTMSKHELPVSDIDLTDIEVVLKIREFYLEKIKSIDSKFIKFAEDKDRYLQYLNAIDRNQITEPILREYRGA